MLKPLFTLSLLIFFCLASNAQLGVMKLVGSGTKDYQLGFGTFIKAGFPAFSSGDLTMELGLNYFWIKDGEGSGTAMVPLKVGYMHMLNGSREGFYVEPQVGYNLYGISSLDDADGYNVDYKYHGVVLAAGAGYVFLMRNTPINLNLRYETTIARGGSNNLVSLGITRSFNIGKRD